MKRLLLFCFVLLSVLSSSAQEVNFVSTAFYNSTTCEVTIQVGLQRKNPSCNNTIRVVSVDFTLQWSSSLQLVSASFIPNGQKLDDASYFSDFGADNGIPLNEYGATNSGNPTSTRSVGAELYKSYNFRRSTNLCSNVLVMNCGMIVPFFIATFKIDCSAANQYSFTYDNVNTNNNSDYIAEFNNGTASPSNNKKEILIVTSQTESFSDVSGGCTSTGEVRNDNTLTVSNGNSFTNTYGAILPVIIDYFKAEQKQPNTIQLEWASLSEYNHLQFVVERSIDQKNWSSIGSIPSAGNGNIRKVYQLTDSRPNAGANHYRLKQVDVEGKGSYSQVVRINNLVVQSLTIFPNPVAATTQLYSKEPFNIGQVIQIIDAKGTRVKTITPTTGNRIQLDFSSYSPGLYLVQLIEQGRVIENLQVVKQ